MYKLVTEDNSAVVVNKILNYWIRTNLMFQREGSTKNRDLLNFPLAKLLINGDLPLESLDGLLHERLLQFFIS
jgi:hypothetical protein